MQLRNHLSLFPGPTSVYALSLAMFVSVGCQSLFASDTSESELDTTSQGGSNASGGTAGSQSSAGSGGSQSSAGSGGSQSSAGSGGSHGTPADCSTSKPTELIKLSGFSVDATEVTRCQYKAWLDTNPTPAKVKLPDECEGWKKNFTPHCDGDDCSWPPSQAKRLRPVVGVDWCDAWAYCHDNGKRLCGNRTLEGGPVPVTDFSNADVDEWYFACSSGGEFAYPYGNTYIPGNCIDDGVGHLEEVGQTYCRSYTHTSQGGVADLSGNVAEWENSCDTVNEAASCRVRGGSFEDSESGLRCDASSLMPRKTRNNSVGFRCCK